MQNASSPLPDVYAGGQPSAEEIQRLAAEGVRTILDLRAPDERRGFDEAAVAASVGVEYVNLPVYYHGIPRETFDRVREWMKDRDKRPTLIHCRSGNRVGAVLMPYLILDEGKSPQEALELAIQAGLASQQLLDWAMAYTREEESRREGSSGAA